MREDFVSKIEGRNVSQYDYSFIFKKTEIKMLIAVVSGNEINKDFCEVLLNSSLVTFSQFMKKKTFLK